MYVTERDSGVSFFIIPIYLGYKIRVSKILDFHSKILNGLGSFSSLLRSLAYSPKTKINFFVKLLKLKFVICSSQARI
jgi:hypothetical protein